MFCMFSDYIESSYRLSYIPSIFHSQYFLFYHTRTISFFSLVINSYPSLSLLYFAPPCLTRVWRLQPIEPGEQNPTTHAESLSPSPRVCVLSQACLSLPLTPHCMIIYFTGHKQHSVGLDHWPSTDFGSGVGRRHMQA